MMCQAYEDERDYLFARDAWVRRRGYDAQKAGIPRESNPEPDHENPEYSDQRQWWMGWDTAANGSELW